VAINDNEFILGNACICSENHRETTKPLKICYCIMRSVPQEWVCRTKISDVHWKWAALSHAVIERVVGEWHQSLCTCVHAGGGHFEHLL